MKHLVALSTLLSLAICAFAESPPVVVPLPPKDPCHLPKEIGPCDGYFPRYYYNAETQQCEKFTYGGCQGNGNNFKTLEECRKTCQKFTDVCSLPKKPGPCRAAIPRYYFNSATKKCEKFTYGGCQGNANNFETLEACRQQCKEIDCAGMHCIHWACSSAKCPAFPNAECRTEPCPCSNAVFYVNGKKVNCNDPHPGPLPGPRPHPYPLPLPFPIPHQKCLKEGETCRKKTGYGHSFFKKFNFYKGVECCGELECCVCNRLQPFPHESSDKGRCSRRCICLAG